MSNCELVLKTSDFTASQRMLQNHYVAGSLQSLNGSQNLTDFFLLSELRDASSIFLSDRILTLIGKHRDILESIHISDQYTGFVQETSAIVNL